MGYPRSVPRLQSASRIDSLYVLHGLGRGHLCERWGPDDMVSGDVEGLSTWVIGQLPSPTPGCMSQLPGGGDRAWGWPQQGGCGYGGHRPEPPGLWRDPAPCWQS